MFRKKNILFFNIDDCWFEKELYHISKAPICIYHGLDLDGLKYKLKIIDHTFTIDLTQTEEAILSKFDKKGLVYPIRNAEKKGYICRKAIDTELTDFLTFFNLFAINKKIPKVCEKELEEMDVFVCFSPDNVMIGGTAFVKSNDKKTYRYKHGANKYSTNANDLMLWTAIKYARRVGFNQFDLGGVKVNQKKDSYYYRHYKYKEKFGGDLSIFYTCVQSNLLFLPVFLVINLVVRLFFKSDFNGLVNFINKIKPI